MCQTAFQLPASCVLHSRQPTADSRQPPPHGSRDPTQARSRRLLGSCLGARAAMQCMKRKAQGEGVARKLGDGSGRRRARRGLSAGAGACGCAFSLLSSFRAVMDRSLTSTSRCVGRWVAVDARTARASGTGGCEMRVRSLQVCESRGSTVTSLHPLAPLAYTPTKASIRCGAVLPCISTSALPTTLRTRWTV